MREQPRTSSPRTRVARAVIMALLLAVPLTVGAHDITMDEGFVPRPTCKTTGSGPFNSPGIWSCGHAPTGSDWVQIDHAVTISGDRNAWTVYVSSSGSLTCDGSGSLTFSDTAPTDTPKFETGLLVLGTFNCVRPPKTAWARTTAEITSGATSITVDACSGWQTGDRILLPDTREKDAIAPRITDQYQPEVKTISAIAGCVITFNSATSHAYTTARDHAGVVERYIPIANLTRDFTFKSASPSATSRGHIMFNAGATVDVEYVSVQDMGRTTIAPINDATNHIGRYPFHLHHLMKPATIVGNVVERSKKWAYTVHASNGSTISSNIAYDAEGWGFGTEDSSEADNVFDHNFCALITGGGAFDNGASHPGGNGANGSCFWLQGPRNILTNNVGLNAEEYGFTVWDSLARPLNTFQNNEGIANLVGLSLWSSGNAADTSNVDHFYEWHSTKEGFYGYGINHITFTDFYSRGDPSAVGSRVLGKNNWFGDYDMKDSSFLRPNIQNKDAGLIFPYGQARNLGGDADEVITVTDAYMYNATDFLVYMTCLSGGARNIRANVVNPRHENPAGVHYTKTYTACGNISKRDRIVVTNYQGVAGDSFEVYSKDQDPSAMIPQTGGPIAGGCPVPGLTNQQCHDAHGVSIYGELTPAAAVPRANIAGKVLPLGSRPASTPTATRTPARPTSSRAPVTTPRTSPLPTTGEGVRSQADYSALPVCPTVSTTVDAAGHHWTIEPPPSFKLLADGASFMGGRGFTYLTTADGLLFVISTTGRSYRLVSFDGGWQVIDPVEIGCRLPPSPSGATVLQQNGYLVDDMGGVWIATCSYYTFATYCPDFEGTTIEPGIILRNGVRLGSGLLNSAGQLQGMGGIRSEPEPNNSPWNLKWCGGEMYMHNYDSTHALDQSQPLVKQFSRWQGRAVYEWAPATESDCGSGAPATTLSPPTNVRIVRDN